jgi:hypothetical protein
VFFYFVHDFGLLFFYGGRFAVGFGYRNFVVYMYLFYFTGKLMKDIAEECRENSLTFCILDGPSDEDLLHFEFFDVVITTYAVLLFDLYISFFSGLILILTNSLL